MSRVSSDEQAKGYSLDVQSEALEKYCERNDIEIVYTFREDHSAKSFDRPAFKEFQEHVKRNKNKIDFLLFTTWDRFSRNVMDAYLVIDKLKGLGIETQAIEQPIDFSIPENKMLLAMYLVMPEIDNDRRSIKVKEGMRAAFKTGRWCSKAPYGYRNTRDENNRPLIVPNQHAESIRHAFERISKGDLQSDLVIELKTRGTPISKSRLSLVLRNPLYMGKIKVPASESEPSYFTEGIHEGIVSETLFLTVQQELNKNHSRKRISIKLKDEKLPLRGILACSKCGEKLTGSRSRGRRGNLYAYYHCNHCSKERYRAEAVNDTLTEVMRGFKFKKANKLIHQALVSRLLKDDTKSRSNEVKKVQSEILKQEDRIQRLQNNLADGIIESEDYLSMKNRFRESKRNAEERLSTMQGDHTGKEELLRKAVHAIDKLGRVYSEANSTDKIKILGSIFPEMIEFDGIKCRTPKINEAILLCLNADKGFSQKKSGTIHNKLELSRLVENTGVEPVTSTLPV